MVRYYLYYFGRARTRDGSRLSLDGLFFLLVLYKISALRSTVLELVLA